MDSSFSDGAGFTVRGKNVFEHVCRACNDTPSHLRYSRRKWGENFHLIGFCDTCGTRIPNWLSHRDMPAEAKEKIPYWPDDAEISQVLEIGQGGLF